MPAGAAEEARTALLDLVPEGFEEVERAGGVELAAYVDPAREPAIRAAFPDAVGEAVEPGWEERWRDFHRPIRVGPLWIGPPWRIPDAGALAVVIDPGLAFGTGAHPSTRLCLEFLLEAPLGAVVDLGCGSGVLAVAAAKLGFGPVRAVDLDPRAVAAARANARANAVSIEVELEDALTAAACPVDLVLANITLDAVRSVGSSLAAERVLTAGYLAAESLEIPGYRCAERRELAGWAADLHVRK